jgi:hypothetical protein
MSNRRGEPQVWNVAEVVAIQRPQIGVVDNGTRGDGEIDLAAARATHLLVDPGRGVSFFAPKGDRRLTRKELLLRAQLGTSPWAPQPFIKNDCRQGQAMALLRQCDQRVERTARSGQRIDQRRCVEMNGHD